MSAIDISQALFQLPEVTSDALYQKVQKVQTTDLTTGVAGTGTGVFDLLMASLKAHLKTEYDANRITGSEYTKAYIGLVTAAMTTALQFLMSNDTSFWQAQNAQIEAITGRINMETARSNYLSAQYDVDTILPLKSTQLTLQNAGITTENSIQSFNLSDMLPAQKSQLVAQTALVTTQNTGEGIKNNIESFNLSDMLPAQKDQLTAQTTMVTTQTAGEVVKNSISSYTLANMLPSQKAILDAQATGEGIKNSIQSYTLASMLPAQLTMLTTQTAGEALKNTGQGTQNAGLLIANDIASYNLANIMPAQLNLSKEQAEVQHAQTSDKRLDGTTAIAGLVGGQKALYTQQVTSYQRDAEVKAAKPFVDAWITQKTIDEGLLAPDGFTNTSLDLVLTKIKTNNGFV